MLIRLFKTLGLTQLLLDSVLFGAATPPSGIATPNAITLPSCASKLHTGADSIHWMDLATLRSRFCVLHMGNLLKNACMYQLIILLDDFRIVLFHKFL